MNIEPSANSTDATLLDRLRRGDDDAATEIYLRYSKRLQRLAEVKTSEDLASRYDAEDVVQSVFRTFFRRASEGYFDLPEGEEIWNLFLVIALNKIRYLGKFHRRKKRSVSQTESATGREESPGDSADQTPLAILRLTVEEILQQLPFVKRTMVEMRIQGHELAEIAKATNRCSRTVERTLRQFRESIASQIDVA